MKRFYSHIVILFCCGFAASNLDAEVMETATNGFSIKTTRKVDLSSDKAYSALVEDFSKWYNADHSYSRKAENLSLDLERHCMLEKLPDGGFVRHMDIVFHQPGKMFRMSGGLGPLQGMGVSGALTFSFKPEGEKTIIEMTYFVSGASFLKLDKIATPVDGVLAEQMDRLKKHCDSLK